MKESIPETPAQQRARDYAKSNGDDQRKNGMCFETHDSDDERKPQHQTNYGTTSNSDNSVFTIWRCHFRVG